MRLDKTTHSLAAVLSNTLKNSNMESRILENICLLSWDEVVGERISAAAQPDGVRDGVIFVKTKSPTWANELIFYKPEIINKLNAKVNKNVIKDIIFKAGKIKKEKTVKANKTYSNLKVDEIELSDEEIEFINKTVSSAGNASNDLFKLMETGLKLDKWKLLNGWTPCKVCSSLQNEPDGVCIFCSIDK